MEQQVGYVTIFNSVAQAGCQYSFLLDQDTFLLHVILFIRELLEKV